MPCSDIALSVLVQFSEARVPEEPYILLAGHWWRVDEVVVHLGVWAEVKLVGRYIVASGRYVVVHLDCAVVLRCILWSRWLWA